MGRNPRLLRGKVAVITGGARGIGAATARALASQGARVVIGDLDKDAASKMASELAIGATHELDVTDPRAFTAFLDTVESEFGPIDVLVNNAGIMPLTDLEHESDDATRRQLEINLHAVIRGSREAIARMRRRGSGHIVNVASGAGKMGLPGAATYCATKHGVVGLSEAVRAELRGSGIEVSCVMPTLVRTELISGLTEPSMLKAVTPEQVAAEIVRALRFPHFDVFVPRRLAAMPRLLHLLPRPAGEWIFRRIGADRVLVHGADSAERVAYESRTALSAPAADQQYHREREQHST